MPLGLLMGFFGTFERLTKPVVEIFRPIPPIAWTALFLIMLGLFWGPIVVIFIGVFFPLLSNVIFGVKSVDRYLIDAAKTLGANRFQVFTKVIFPATVPYMMTGITIGLGIGWMCIVAAEMVSVVGGGVGYYIYINGVIGRWPYMYGGMVVIAILGILTVGLSRIAENRLSKQMGLR
ncbi:MAG TPA: ABC transporter permease subunit [Methanomassiliicoccales archaeon]|nr:ABC transporter permease subunit [Methanomassiliicoccales archaeon]